MEEEEDAGAMQPSCPARLAELRDLVLSLQQQNAGLERDNQLVSLPLHEMELEGFCTQRDVSRWLQAKKQAERADLRRQELEHSNSELRAKQMANVQQISILEAELELSKKAVRQQDSELALRASSSRVNQPAQVPFDACPCLNLCRTFRVCLDTAVCHTGQE